VDGPHLLAELVCIMIVAPCLALYTRRGVRRRKFNLQYLPLKRAENSVLNANC